LHQRSESKPWEATCTRYRRKLAQIGGTPPDLSHNIVH